MNKKRPVNLDILTISQPVTAIVSILHRVTGIILFVGLAFLFYAFDLSLESQEGFDQVVNALQTSFLVKFVIWGVVSALMYHFVAGVKHLFMDMGYFEELESGRHAAIANIVIAAVLIVLAGVWIW
ncbi:MAG: succinate dehydrogenase, cytochrome b556 subunit [Gammaproteobacteria bacterium]|uniref:succinate dehydrogenase, cytochrome b556 subunit n=1 Tax=Marinomonas TaxID=28253 RepID=UPI000934E4C8|nr:MULTISPECIES: succinate dehydrogenase, cytochrome b556 subunit [Marinomonas]MBU1295314.1 succinate dehydrogenase, cytochrome b556 subunit [Gammaproteobacteria bacterium]MBU1468853.1 succinate dehydrogenase, cytochrome b556 subunit [Gammaproteobacteria bacterium]MBU2021570.1 succinate dehydrogenase, cytochrome b556 subunit [Gammaproteobacteria bacterium]MBU2236512.1 succinate dehydrogenase, cytochrome b556 subunit [Gammaproteobacteria bacterium]MBU2317807.1 succinate dehydrogenase, cytochrom